MDQLRPEYDVEESTSYLMAEDCEEDGEDDDGLDVIEEEDSHREHTFLTETIENTPMTLKKVDIKNLSEVLEITLDRPSTTTTRKRKKPRVPICTCNCRYEVVRRCAKQLGMKEVGEDDDWLLFWTDCSVSLDRVMNMKRYQKINHFPGMSEICRKDMLARNMNRLYKAYPKDYNIFPKSWVLPADYGDFQAFFRLKKNKCYIVKPEMGCQGKGIFMTKNPSKDIKATEHMVVQQYISRPLLMDGMKFDLRVYAMVSSCDPLRIYVFNEGLVRLATVNYTDPTTSNTDEVCMHLTNYAINKHSENFVRPTGSQSEDSQDASKRSFAFLRQWMDHHGYDREQIFADINDVIIKTIVTAHPILRHNYRTCFPQPWRGSACFEILGFDVLLDRKLKPWLLEVNHSPSFHTDSRLDKQIKTALIRDTLSLLDLRTIDRKKCLEEDRKRVQARLTQPRQESRESKMEKIKSQTDEWLKSVEKYEQSKIGGYLRIYPPEKPEDADKYSKFFNSSASVFQTTAAQRAREEAARIQLEELRLKNAIEQAKRQGKPIPDMSGVKKGESNVDVVSNPSSTKLRASRSKLFSGKRGSRYNREVPPVDIMVPVNIADTEENERKFQLRQRAAQIKSLGIVDLVHRLLAANREYQRAAENKESDLRDARGRKIVPQEEQVQHSRRQDPVQISSGVAGVVDKLAAKSRLDAQKRDSIDTTTKSIISYFSSLDHGTGGSIKTSADRYNPEKYGSCLTAKEVTKIRGSNSSQGFITCVQQAPSIPTLQNAWRRQNQPHFALTIKPLSNGGSSGKQAVQVTSMGLGGTGVHAYGVQTAIGASQISGIVSHRHNAGSTGHTSGDHLKVKSSSRPTLRNTSRSVASAKAAQLSKHNTSNSTNHWPSSKNAPISSSANKAHYWN